MTLPPCEKLYETDAYVREFEAVVLAADGQRFRLSRTAFYPGGGGQPCDKGGLIHHGNVRAVSDVRRRDGEIWHTIMGNPIPEGASILGHIDWQRRYALMRTHTALHMLSAVVFKDHGKQATGGDMQPLSGRLDFDMEILDLALANAIERRLNEEVAAARPVKIAILPREEAFKIPDLIRTKVNLLPPGIRLVRTVEIVGLEIQADSGTHVANTREVGPVKLVGYEGKGRKNKRLRIELAPPAGAATAPVS